MKAIIEQGKRRVKVISDDTDVFVLLIHFYWALSAISKLLMEETNGEEKKIVDICETVKKHIDIIPYILAAHGISGCDTVAMTLGRKR